MLHDQPATVSQPGRRPTHDAPQRRQAVRPADQGGPRLEAQVALGEVGVVGGDVWRIGNDHVELAGDGGVPVREPKASGAAETRRVLAGERETGRVVVHAKDGGGRSFRHERQRDGAATGAKVQHSRGGAGTFQRSLHHALRLRARHEGARVHPQRQAPELPFTQDVRHRLATPTPLHEGREASALGGNDGALREGVQRAAWNLQRPRRQKLRLETRQGGAGGVEAAADGAQARGGHGPAPRAASWSAWCSRANGSTSASKSPAKISSNR